MREVAGDGAVLVDPYNVEEIRGAVDLIIRDANYRGKVIDAGLKNVERFSPEVVAGQYAALYHVVFASQA
jgi:glycosyltransferase involved in cell wall biosynthesis